MSDILNHTICIIDINDNFMQVEFILWKMFEMTQYGMNWKMNIQLS